MAGRIRLYGIRGNISTILILVFWTEFSTWATDGIKGGQRPRYPRNGNYHGSNLLQLQQKGLCYKMVPHLALNSSASPYNTISQPPKDQLTHIGGLITILDCCYGYKHNVASGLCEFDCDHGCFGGRCTEPNICNCQPGWRPEDGVCKPVCTNQCQENAYCSFPERVCVCKLGYDEVNGQCEPICPDGCKHGDCVAPRVCQCRPGYVWDKYEGCVAAYKGGCENGTFTGPGVCTCNEGYINPGTGINPGDRKACIPHCPGNCDGGECIAPNICRCGPGFTHNRTNGCVPDCPNGCDGGECIAPNVCTLCRSEYTWDRYSGRCVPASSGSSQCRYGYTVDPDTDRCVPAPTSAISSSDCRYNCGLYGICVGHNQCACRPGYEFAPNTHRCVLSGSSNSISSQCRYGCGPNARCDSINGCVCNPGFRMSLHTYRCTQTEWNGWDSSMCPSSCWNGQCTGPFECTCNQGYIHNPDTHDYTKCVPVCVGGCPNGVCTFPNFCICYPGYRKESVNGRQRCVPQE